MRTKPQAMLSISEAAEQLNVSTKTIRRYIGSGKLAGYRLGGHLIRLEQSQVDGLLRPMPNARMGRGDAA